MPFLAVGRVDLGVRKSPLKVVRRKNGDLCCTDSKGFRIYLRVGDIPLDTIRFPLYSVRTFHGSKDGGTQERLGSKRIYCVLSDGTRLKCEGYYSPENNVIRVDAMDMKGQSNLHWFWFEVRTS